MANADYIQSLTSEINNIQACNRLQEVANLAMSYVQDEINSLENEILSLAGQMTVPKDLGDVINWILGEIGSKYAAYKALINQLTAIQQEGQALVNAIQNALRNIENCNIGVSLTIPTPTITIPTIESLNGGINPFG